MRARAYVAAGAATVVLTAGSVVAMAATGSNGCRVPSLGGQRVNVVLADMGGRSMMGGSAMMGGRMMLRVFPQTVSAGTVSLLAVNHGTRRHEVVVLALPAGAAVGTRTVGADNQVDESASLGEASRACGAGAGNGIRSGGVGWVTLHLAPGRYELVCNRPGHYADGMFAELDVR